MLALRPRLQLQPLPLLSQRQHDEDQLPVIDKARAPVPTISGVMEV
jgi:hypothetical protein